MARRKSTNTEDPVPPPSTPAEAPAADGDPLVRRRRRRRTTAAVVPDMAEEAVLLVEATLKSRGCRGATPEILQEVVNWARGVRFEGDELRLLAARPRRLKTQAPNDRLSRYEVNRALLDGVLSGTIILDVQLDGALTFMHCDYVSGSQIFDAAPSGIPAFILPTTDESV